MSIALFIFPLENVHFVVFFVICGYENNWILINDNDIFFPWQWSKWERFWFHIFYDILHNESTWVQVTEPLVSESVLCREHNELTRWRLYSTRGSASCRPCVFADGRYTTPQCRTGRSFLKHRDAFKSFQVQIPTWDMKMIWMWSVMFPISHCIAAMQFLVP